MKLSESIGTFQYSILATSTDPGIIKKSTNSDTVTGTADDTAVTPASLTSKIDTDSTFEENSDLYIPSQKAIKSALDDIKEDNVSQLFFATLI